MWEYTTIYLAGNGGGHFNDDLNKMGDVGWELVAANFSGYGHVCFFKRQKDIPIQPTYIGPFNGAHDTDYPHIVIKGGYENLMGDILL